MTDLQSSLFKKYGRIESDNIPNKYTSPRYSYDAADANRTFQNVRNALKMAQNLEVLQDPNRMMQVDSALELILSGQIITDPELDLFIMTLFKQLNRTNDPNLKNLKNKVSLCVKSIHES